MYSAPSGRVPRKMYVLKGPSLFAKEICTGVEKCSPWSVERENQSSELFPAKSVHPTYTFPPNGLFAFASAVIHWLSAGPPSTLGLYVPIGCSWFPHFPVNPSALDFTSLMGLFWNTPHTP